LRAVRGVQQMQMLDALDRILRERLPKLMRPESRPRWNSVHVTYHPPRVERLWTQVDDHRLFLHRIYPCEEGDALFHPHPWPSAVQVVSGRYEHQTGIIVAPGFRRGVVRSVLVVGSSYEMKDRRAWHSVRPLDGPSDSIMLVGPLYDPPVEMPHPPTKKQGPLEPDRFEALFEEWRDRIDPSVECGTCGWRGTQDELECYRDGDGRPVEMGHARCPSCFDEDQVMSRRRR